MRIIYDENANEKIKSNKIYFNVNKFVTIIGSIAIFIPIILSNQNDIYKGSESNLLKILNGLAIGVSCPLLLNTLIGLFGGNYKNGIKKILIHI